MKILIVCSTLDLKYKMGCTPHWWQLFKGLYEIGCEVIVINPNIATYQTSKGLSDKVYFLPVDPYFVNKIKCITVNTSK